MSTPRISSIKEIPDISFIDNDTIEDMRARLVRHFEEEYERQTGQAITLAPADPNRVMLYAIALDLYQAEQYVDRAGKQDLIKYSYGGFLENLGASRSVTRNPAAPSKTIIQFSLQQARREAVAIPEGTRVSDGNKNYFKTTEYAEIIAGNTSVEVEAICTVEGSHSNDILPGQITKLIDLIPYVSGVYNITATSEGADVETDESLAERIFLAPAGYSVAGPDDAYVFWAKTYNQMIGDVNIYSPSPVDVEVRVLMTDGSLPTGATIDGLTDYLMDEHIRPLTDRVRVLPPEESYFDIDLDYYINESNRSITQTIQRQVMQAIEDYKVWQTYTIGRDINPSELIKRIVAAGAKRVTVRSPIFKKVPDTSVARIGTVSISYGGIERD